MMFTIAPEKYLSYAFLWRTIIANICCNTIFPIFWSSFFTDLQSLWNQTYGTRYYTLKPSHNTLMLLFVEKHDEFIINAHLLDGKTIKSGSVDNSTINIRFCISWLFFNDTKVPKTWLLYIFFKRGLWFWRLSHPRLDTSIHLASSKHIIQMLVSMAGVRVQRARREARRQFRGWAHSFKN